MATKNKLLFSLDIGTRSVIGIVAEQNGSQLKIIATERKEHRTRAMLDGQIHDVPQVAAILEDVKNALEVKTGPLKQVAVAAAGRALYTMTSEAELEINEVITAETERSLDFIAIQTAQHKLATSNTVADPTLYYCVGYSTVKYTLDGTQLKTLVGQRGKLATATVIATFLPRQVIDSMQSALDTAKLEMSALTLEPIAAINVLIPPTMRHLNLVLVDIGAGTSDVAVTKDGSVTGYGMVPLAGDEITEAISQKYLLDFNIAETVKRDISADKAGKVTFQDILGVEYKLSPKEVIDSVMPNILDLAQAIAKQILELNSGAPQAVLLVGGGSLTPELPEMVAQALDIPSPRVAVRKPETIEGIESIPEELKSPDAVTPLGILKIASLNALHFLSIAVNEQEFRLFNFGHLTVSDALLTAGINLKKLGGKPGLGLMITLNGEKKYLAGTMGTNAKITLNDEIAALKDPIKNGDKITIENGCDGIAPEVKLQTIIKPMPPVTIFINGSKTSIPPTALINGQSADMQQLLVDHDEITWHETKNLGEVLLKAGYTPTARKFKYLLNGAQSMFSVSPTITINGNPATLSTEVFPNDEIDFIEPTSPKLGDVIKLSELDTHMIIYFNKSECKMPAANCQMTVNGKSATANTIVYDGSEIEYTLSERKTTIVSDVLLAADFHPPSALSQVTFKILVNGQSAEFITPVKNGDKIDVLITPIEHKVTI